MRNLLFIGIVISLLAGCSRSTIIFNIADTLLISQTDKYFDLDRSQKEELKKNLNKDLDGLRKEMFPRVAESFRHLAPQTQTDKLSDENLDETYQQFFEYFKETSGRFKNTAIQLTLTLKPEQFSYFEKAVQKDIAKLEKKYKDPEEALESSQEKYERSLELWFGDLSRDQKNLLVEFLKENPFPWKLQAENKAYLLKQFLARQQDKEKLREFVENYHTDYESLRLPEFKEALDQHKSAFQQFLSQRFWEKLTTEQKNFLQKNLKERAEDLDKLASK